MKKKKTKKGYVDRSETFDQFLAKDGLLAETEDAALKEIIVDQIMVALISEGLTEPRWPSA
jgi:antitoxin HicB